MREESQILISFVLESSSINTRTFLLRCLKLHKKDSLCLLRDLTKEEANQWIFSINLEMTIPVSVKSRKLPIWTLIQTKELKVLILEGNNLLLLPNHPWQSFKKLINLKVKGITNMETPNSRSQLRNLNNELMMERKKEIDSMNRSMILFQGKVEYLQLLQTED